MIALSYILAGCPAVPTNRSRKASTKGSMIVMPSNNTGFEAGVLFGKFPGRMAHLHSVDAPREPKQDFPWALDNGVFGAWASGKTWSEEPLYRYLDAYAGWNPEWVVVPDWVGDRDETLRRWDIHAPALQAFGCPLAMAVQDGMTPEDVPAEAAVVFIGGSTAWKWSSLPMWTEAFERVHVGRVNSRRLLEQAEEAGAESCDGTGWFRHPKRTQELERYLAGLPYVVERSRPKPPPKQWKLPAHSFPNYITDPEEGA